MDGNSLANIPIILVIAGLFFILISNAKISGQLNIELDEKNAKTIFKIGTLVLLLGLILFTITYLDEKEKPTQKKAPTTGSISLDSSPSGANIYLDNNIYKGKTPTILEDIGQGSHTIILKFEEYEDWSQNISVDAGKTISISPTLTPKEKSTTPQIHITYPLNGSTVQSSENVKGTVENLPDGYTILLFAYPQIDGKYYPEMNNGQTVYIENGTWSEITYIGLEDNSGEYFDIVATLADQKAQEDVKNYFIKANKTQKWGMPSLPASINVYDKITVKRI